MSGFYFRKAYLAIGPSREILATNVSVNVTNRAGIRTTDAATGQFDDTAPAAFDGTFNVIPATSGGIDYFTYITTPGQRHHTLRFSTADGVLTLEAALTGVSETQPDDPAGHERTITVKGIVRDWRAA